MSAWPHAVDRRRFLPVLIFVVLILFFFLARFISSFVIELAWWEEMHQVDTWINQFAYGTVPSLVLTILFFVVFWQAYRLGLRRGAAYSSTMPSSTANRLTLLGLFLLALLAANMSIDSWTVVRYFAGLRLPSTAGQYSDPIFHLPLRFYFFDLPFYQLALGVVFAGVILSLLIFWLSAHLGQLRDRFPQFASPGVIDVNQITFGGAFDSSFVRILIATLLVCLAAKFYFDRYNFLFQDHGTHLVGVNWVTDHVSLPLQWLLIIAALAAAGLVLARKPKVALLLLVVLPVRFVLPSIVSSLYVRPNELNLERPYIANHIEGTRTGFRLNTSVTETQLEAQPEIKIDYAKHKSLLDNVRLWDWQAYHDTISQIQPLRPYIYATSDVDRYVIDGELRQVMLTPRELDIQQLGEARHRWINPHFVYTHGYGLVMAEANRITADGLPMLFIENAPVMVNTKSLKVTKPEIYYSEITHEPVFVGTDQLEFNYPTAADVARPNKAEEAQGHVKYAGTGGFPISSFGMRVAAAVDYADPNILLTSNMTDGSRMMIHRQIVDRVSKLAGFLSWDSDPYLVVGTDGRLVWLLDGYMLSALHPYSADWESASLGSFNYIRNSVKAAVDAYSGETHLYVFDTSDPLIAAYQQLFPQLLESQDKMPADLLAHVRYPETMFQAQADIYRNFHMRDPEAFYNRADTWDLVKTGTNKNGVAPASPTYVMAALPGQDKGEFLLITEFTPANKDNLIGMMLARCDGEHYGELVIQQLSKQNIIYGPMQIEARINQDQTISKDLTLWGQQGSQVVRGQPLVLPIENSFLYVTPIYIQASQARMPQLRKVALAMGNLLAYQDTYEQALQELMGQPVESRGGATSPQTSQTAPAAPALAAGVGHAPSELNRGSAQTLNEVRDHLRKYRELTGQGKWSEAAKEMEQAEELLNQTQR